MSGQGSRAHERDDHYRTCKYCIMCTYCTFWKVAGRKHHPAMARDWEYARMRVDAVHVYMNVTTITRYATCVLFEKWQVATTCMLEPWVGVVHVHMKVTTITGHMLNMHYVCIQCLSKVAGSIDQQWLQIKTMLEWMCTHEHVDHYWICKILHYACILYLQKVEGRSITQPWLEIEAMLVWSRAHECDDHYQYAKYCTYSIFEKLQVASTSS